MNKYFKILIVLFLIGFTTCNEAQENEKSILKDCFKQHFFKKESSLLKLEKELKKKGFIKDGKAKSYQLLFRDYIYLNSIGRSKEFYQKKYLISTILNNNINKKVNIERVCFPNQNPMEIFKNSLTVLNFINFDKKENKKDLPIDWYTLKQSEIFMKLTKTKWFKNEDVKYIVLDALKRNIINYSKEKMNIDIGN